MARRPIRASRPSSTVRRGTNQPNRPNAQAVWQAPAAPNAAVLAAENPLT